VPGALEKQHGLVLDLLETLSLKAKTDLSLVPKVQEVEKSVKGLEMFMRGLRTFLAETDMLEIGDDIANMLPKAKDMEDQAVCHMDGLKIMMKRVRAFW